MNDEKKINKIEWKAEYSVHVAEIDAQHKKLIEIINQLMSVMYDTPTDEALLTIISQLLAYKKEHFQTEEKYFEQFGYAHQAEHEAQHRGFTESVESLQEQWGTDPLVFSFKLVDFLESWFVNHMLHADQEYITCFQANGLR